MAEIEHPDYTTLTVQLLSAYVANNKVDSGDLATLIQSTRAALVGEAPGAAQPEYTPAVSVEDSLASREYIVSLIDGKPYKMLRRHLAHHGLSPEQYRARYNLPESYPLVAPAYAELRRDVARRMGLGHTTKPGAPAAPSSSQSAPAPAKAAEKQSPAQAGKMAAPKSSRPDSPAKAKALTAKPAATARKRADNPDRKPAPQPVRKAAPQAGEPQAAPAGKARQAGRSSTPPKAAAKAKSPAGKSAEPKPTAKAPAKAKGAKAAASRSAKSARTKLSLKIPKEDKAASNASREGGAKAPTSETA